jgi:LDH2 family malate/lactate/ureidoglycolate dehydrogenase
MSLVFELLAGGLVANPIVPGYHSGSADGRRHQQNGFLLAVDVSAFLPLDEFTATVDATVDAIKALPPSDGAAEVLVPGERGRRSEADRLSGGVPLGAKVWRELSSARTPLAWPCPPRGTASCRPALCVLRPGRSARSTLPAGR